MSARLLLVLGVVLVGVAPAARAGQGLGLDAALAVAEASDTRVLVRVTAPWCTACAALGRELLDAPAGAALREGLVVAEVDFDAPASRAFVERYVIVSLPTVLLLEPDGGEVGRVQGYEDAKAWRQAWAALRAQGDALPGLEAAWRAAPDDPAALLALGAAWLLRGRQGEAEPLLGRGAWSGAPAQAAHALFVLGRYHQRVRRDPARAQGLWRELATRFPDEPEARGSWWWYATAQAAQGRPGLGARVLADHARAHPGDPELVSQWGAYLVEHHPDAPPGERAAAHRALEAALKDADPDTRAAYAGLLTKLKPAEAR